MPSGSGGHGGGGSHFGGGGGSHFGGGGRGGSGGSRPPRPIYFGFGGTRYYVPLKKSNAIRSFFVLAIFFVVVAAVLMLGGFAPNNNLKKITADRQRYIEMINRAEKDSSYVREGTITGTFYNSDCGKWYFTYVIPTDDGYGNLEGYSYSIYDGNEIKNFVPGKTLEFAVGFTPVTFSTDSIDMGYKNKPLTDDGEYISIVKERRNLRAFGILSCVASAGFLTAGAALLFKNLRKKETAGETTEEENGIPIRRCEYCGSVLSGGETKCPNCGASIRKQ